MDISKVVDWLRLPLKTIVGIAVASSVLLFSPHQFLASLGLDTAVHTVRPMLGIVFVVSVSIVVVAGLAGVARFFKPWIVQWYLIFHGRRRLHQLTPDEKTILGYYLRNQTRSQSLPLQSGVVHALERERIIIRASNLGQPGTLTVFDFCIQPWAWEYLNAHPEIVE